MRAPADDQSCVSDEELIGLVEQRLGAPIVLAIDRHTARCAACAELREAVAVSYFAGSTPTKGGAEVTLAARGTARKSAALAAYTPPMEFDSFRLRTLIGQGAMGQVWL